VAQLLLVTGDMFPLESFEKEANLDKTFLAFVLHLGHCTGSSTCLMLRSSSNFSLHSGQ
jgi:hypothetical protein